MEHWNKCSMACLYFDETPADEHTPCKVTFDSPSISIEYFEDGELFRYTGQEQSPGHYVLHCHILKGQATLHRLPESKFLEGYWIEGGDRGMWRITLINE